MTFHMPAEWAPHDAVWLAWPSHPELWLDNLASTQQSFAALALAIADPDEQGRPQGERLEVLVPTERAALDASQALQGTGATLHRIPFGDIWLRDTAPIFVECSDATLTAVCCRFNGWGNKYILEHDTDVALAIARASGHRWVDAPLVLEGGSVEVDGNGTAITTEQCLLNANRNPSMGRREVESALGHWLGASTVRWISEGLANDHTDGHIDTIVRFVAPGVVVCMEARDRDDPNAAVLSRIVRELEAMHVEVVRIPSPGRIEDADGLVMPASYVNFYIANRVVVVPTYGTRWDDVALAELGPLFPGRRVVGIAAKGLLSGGGAFHCISQQQPVGQQ